MNIMNINVKCYETEVIFCIANLAETKMIWQLLYIKIIICQDIQTRILQD